MMKNVPPNRKETEFALAALMEIPTQYKATIDLNILGSRRRISPQRVALPPPVHVAPSFSSSKPSHSTGFQEPQPYYDQNVHVTVVPYYAPTNVKGTTPPISASTYENQARSHLPNQPKGYGLWLWTSDPSVSHHSKCTLYAQCRSFYYSCLCF